MVTTSAGRARAARRLLMRRTCRRGPGPPADARTPGADFPCAPTPDCRTMSAPRARITRPAMSHTTFGDYIVRMAPWEATYGSELPLDTAPEDTTEEVDVGVERVA